MIQPGEETNESKRPGRGREMEEGSCNVRKTTTYRECREGETVTLRLGDNLWSASCVEVVKDTTLRDMPYRTGTGTYL